MARVVAVADPRPSTKPQIKKLMLATKTYQNCGRGHSSWEKSSAAGQSCHKCKKVGHLKAQCRSPSGNSAKNKSEARYLCMVEQLTSASTIMLTKRGSRTRRNTPKQYELRVQPKKQTLSHMEYRGNQ